MLAVAVAFASVSSAAAQQPNQPNPLFKNTKDPATIQTQLQLGMSSLERGVQLLQAAADPSQADRGVAALGDAYRYLRAAQESSDSLNIRKYPDPMVTLRNQRILKVRDRLLKCRSGYTPDQQGITMCSDEATAALRELRIALEVFR